MTESMLDKWSKHHDEYLEMFDVIENLAEMGLIVAKEVKDTETGEFFLSGATNRQITDAFLKKHGINEAKLEEERRALLEDCRFRNWKEEIKREIKRNR